MFQFYNSATAYKIKLIHLSTGAFDITFMQWTEVKSIYIVIAWNLWEILMCYDVLG